MSTYKLAASITLTYRKHKYTFIKHKKHWYLMYKTMLKQRKGRNKTVSTDIEAPTQS